MRKLMNGLPGAGLALALALLAAPVAAQQPTQAQANAIRQSCRADFQSRCSGVSPGGQAALTCLQQNAATVSAPCQQALAALGGAGMGSAAPVPGAPAPRAATPMPAQRLPVREACRGDFLAYCRGVRPGGGAALACLRENAPNLSGGCQQALSALRGAMAR